MCFHGPFPTDLRELHRLSHGSPCIYYDLYRAVRCAVHTRIYVGPILRCEDIRLGEEAVGHLHIFRIGAEMVVTFKAWHLSMQGPGAPIEGDSFGQWRVVFRGFANLPH